jgi:hypothetical protein
MQLAPQLAPQLAYAISGYKQPGQFRWLLAAIWDPRDVYAVHIDAKTPEPVFEEFRRIAGERRNVFFVPRRRVAWMGAGLIDAWMDSASLLLRQAPQFSHLINLSMQDYPLRDRESLLGELARAPGLNFVSREPLAGLPWHIRRRPWLWCFEHGDRVVRTPLPRLMPRGLHIAWKGSWWHVLTREAVAWLTTATQAQRYLAYLRYTQAPDELFVQNALLGGPFADRLADRNRHLVLWPGDSGSPYTLTMAHHDQLATSPMWWARKLDESVDRTLLKRLAARIGAPVPA